MQTQWFELDLDTLSLNPSELSTWPKGMGTSQRMHEEALETVIAFNLDKLFPREQLLLVNTQHSIGSMADVVAIDGLGFARLMELKAQPTHLDGDLWAQALSYGLRAVGESQTSWHRELGQALPRFPEDTVLRAEMLRTRRRSTQTGRKFLEESGATLSSSYKSLNFFQRQGALISELRRQRGHEDGFAGVSDPLAASVLKRAYGLSLDRLASESPENALQEVLNRWGGRRSRVGAELTIVAPNVNNEDNVAQVMQIEKRYVPFHLIDAELRWDANPPNPRVVLSWSPGYRTTPTLHHQFAIQVRNIVKDFNPPAADFDWNYVLSPRRRITWGHQTEMMAETNHETNQIVTKAEWLVDGIEDARSQRRKGMTRLANKLETYGVQREGKELIAPWGEGDPHPAAHLLSGYHDLITQELAYGEFDRYRRLGES